jgi:putative membrane protein
MKPFLVRVVINAVALWITTIVVSAGVTMTSYEPGDSFATVVTYLLVALIFGVVNATIGNVIRIVAFPLYILTLGLFALVVNSLLLLLVSWISSLIGFGLTVDDFGWGVVAAIVLGIVSWLLAILLRPLLGKNSSSR